MVLVANELRRAHGPSFLVETLYERALQTGQHLCDREHTNAGEVYALRQKGAFVLLAIDADPALRYQRIQARNSETDQISFETFLENEAREMTSKDPHHQNCAPASNSLITFSGMMRIFRPCTSRLRSRKPIVASEKCAMEDAVNRGYIRPTWDEYFMEVANAIAKRATCDRGRSGCVIARNRRSW
jgi:hypothetical protein